MKRFFLVLFCILAIPVWASHIVGGEFELIHLGNHQYRLSLIYYFDLLNNQFSSPTGDPEDAQPELQEPSITVAIYRKSDNALMQTVALNFASKTRVSYSQPLCSQGEIKTDKLIYSSIITLPVADYSDPAGYYVVWERCCRNYKIVNIFSDIPANSPATAAGQTFYLEFPPVSKNGKAFINSSPRLFPPLNDYACPNTIYYADFAGQDDDGDDLVYSLVTPLSTHTVEALPPLLSAPYPLVQWRQAYSEQNIMKGNPDLSITKDGFLTVKPSSSGLFVFAVKCEEFREGVKIGEVRRDFQLYVLDFCKIAVPPQIVGRIKNTASYTAPNAPLNVNFSKATSDADRCIEVQISDEDSKNIVDNKQENITLYAIQYNPRKDISYILPVSRSAVLVDGSNVTFEICFDKCPLEEDGQYRIGIIARDDACALPLTDTLVINVNIEPPFPTNNDPELSTTLTPFEKQFGVTRRIYQPVNFDINGKDIDGNSLELNVEGIGFDYADYGISISGSSAPATSPPPTQLQYKFNWDLLCNQVNLAEYSAFDFRFILIDDKNPCEYYKADTLFVTVNVLPPINNKPILQITNTNPDIPFDNNLLTPLPGQQISLALTSTDPDQSPQDNIRIELLNASGNVEPKGYVFSPATGVGAANTTFVWNMDCSLFSPPNYENNYKFKFRTYDDRCVEIKGDTVEVDIKLKDLDRKDENFIPPNFISPNGDSQNDFFAMVRLDPDTHELINILPVDNCSGRFLSMTVFNRWGREVYETTDRDFRWYPEDASAGIYFYTLTFSDREYKGTITLRD